MKTFNLIQVAVLGLVAGAGLLLSSCGSSGGGGLVEPVCDASGDWLIYATVSTSSPYCSDENGTSQFVYPTLSQSGNTLTVVISGDSFTGTISGDRVSWTGSYPEDGGTTTETLTATVNSSCTEISGSTTWSWTDGFGSCTGSSTFTGIWY